MSQNIMLLAYAYLVEKGRSTILEAELKSWDLLEQVILETEAKESILEELSKEQLAEVREDVRNDCIQLADYLSDLEQGVEEFAEMGKDQLESFLLLKSAEVADPTELMILRMRMMAALEESEKK